MRIEKLTNKIQLKQLMEVYCLGFNETHTIPSDKRLQELLENKTVHFYGVLVEDRVVAGMTIYILPSFYTNQDYYYIYDMAVLPEEQNKGYGSALLEFAKELGKKHQAEAVYIEADDIDTVANHLYNKYSVDKVHCTSYDIYQEEKND